MRMSPAAHGERETGPLVPLPVRGRTFSAHRRIGLSDMDARGRLRFDAVARFLQDVAIDDVSETGWGLPDHLWFIRSIRVDVLAPVLEDQEVEVVTWCSGVAPIAAGRRWSLSGALGGRIEVDSVWIHLGPDERPARLDEFGLYAEAAGGREVSTKLRLADPPPGAERLPWAVRATDVDRHGHVNNSMHWHAVEERLCRREHDPTEPLRAFLDYRQPIDLDDDVSLVEWGETNVELALVTTDAVKAVARVESFDPVTQLDR